MKKTILFASILFFSINSIAQSNIATVKKIQGLYIFSDNEPISDYTVFGEISISTQDALNDLNIKNSGGQYQPCRDFLITKTRLSNNMADGIILNLINGGIDKAIIIKFKENAVNKDYAKVNKYQGVYTFIDCEPNNKYQSLGTVKFKKELSFKSSQYSSVRDVLIKRTLKEYNNSNGIILRLVTGGADLGESILIKE